MRELYCDRCGEKTLHGIENKTYYCRVCNATNYLKAEVDNPEEFNMEKQRLKNLQNKLIVETGFPF